MGQPVVYHIGKVGRIEQGPDEGRFVRVTAEPGKQGGYRFEIAGDPAFETVVGEQWAAEIEALPDLFDELGSPIDWS